MIKADLSGGGKRWFRFTHAAAGCQSFSAANFRENPRQIESLVHREADIDDGGDVLLE